MPAGLADGLALALREALSADHHGTRPKTTWVPRSPDVAGPGTRLMCAHKIRQLPPRCAPPAWRAAPDRRSGDHGEGVDPRVHAHADLDAAVGGADRHVLGAVPVEPYRPRP